MPDKQLENIITEYRHYLQWEKNLSRHSVEAYLRDLEAYLRFLEQEGEAPASLARLNKDTLRDFVYRISQYISPRSQARLLSGLRNFFNYLVLEDWMDHNPADWVESPKLDKKIPQVLSLEEIDRIMEVIDLSTPEGERNRVMIEMMYACGLRVSEVVDLRLGDLFLDEGFMCGAREANIALCRWRSIPKKCCNVISITCGCMYRWPKGTNKWFFSIAGARN